MLLLIKVAFIGLNEIREIKIRARVYVDAGQCNILRRALVIFNESILTASSCLPRRISSVALKQTARDIGRNINLYTDTLHTFIVYEYLCLLIAFFYVEYANRPIALKHTDKMQRDASWLVPDRIHGYKDSRFAQKIDPRSYYSALRGIKKSKVSLYRFIDMMHGTKFTKFTKLALNIENVTVTS